MARSSYLGEQQLQSLKAEYEGQIGASKFQELVDFMDTLKIQVGVLGQRGTGVTTLVEALVEKPRKLPNDPWAYFRNVPPPTQQAVVHDHPAYPNLTLHDLPGFEASEKPAAYLKRLGDLSKYSCLVVVVGGEGLRDTHLQVLRAIKQKGKTFHLARTKIDLDLHTAERRLRSRFNRAEQLRLIRKEMAETLTKDNMKPNIFLVSGLEPEGYEFARFEDSLEGEVLNLKRNRDGSLDDLTVVSEKKIKDLYRICETASLSEIPLVICSELKDPTHIRLDVAVIGEVGSGISSLINALIGVGSGEPEVAPTGVTEMTKKAVAYRHPTIPCFYLWDLPGVGVMEEDVSHLDLGRYDFFLLVASERYKHTHSYLARAISSAGKRAFFVRTKIDVDLETRPGGQPVCKEKLEEEVRKNCTEALKKDGVDAPQVFLVSCFRQDANDLVTLQEALKISAPELKKQALKRAIPMVVSRLVTRKAKWAMKEMWSKVLQICLSCVNYSQTDLAKKVIATVNNFCFVFGLDEYSLEKTAKATGKGASLLKAEIRSVFTKPLKEDYVLHLITEPVGLTTRVWSYVPYFGNNVKAEPQISLQSTYGMFKQVVVELCEDAERVLLRACMEN